MKKQLLLSLLGVLFLSACASSQAKGVEDGHVLYEGTVKEIVENGILVHDLNPVEAGDTAGFSEVILLMDEVNPDLKADDIIEVVLIEHAPTTRSLPPQIAGNAIVQVELAE